jgi:cell wall-associated NlpC family hydrolase
MGKFGMHVALVLACGVVSCKVLARQGKASSAAGRSAHHANTRLLPPVDGLTVLAAALKLRAQLDSGYDCSHLVHTVYDQAGFPYKYATASELYAGISEFRRVWHPQPGDLVVFHSGPHAHVGIMVNPARRLFFSGLSHGPGVSSYASRYWRARGYPRFFRYIRKLSRPTRTASLQQSGD